MHFDRRFLLVISMSLAWALVVSVVFYRLAGGAGGRARTGAEKQVVVATRPLPAGSTVDRSAVSLRSVPEKLFPAGAFSRVEDVLDRPVIGAIQADEPLVEARLAVKGSGVGLGPLIPPECAPSQCASTTWWVSPASCFRACGWTCWSPASRPTGPTRETQTVLQNIAVLSAGQTIQTDGKSQPIVAPW